MSRRTHPQALCDAWNALHPIGTAVLVTRDDGSRTATVTRSEAEALSGHTPVIWLAGIRGCYLLERVEVTP